MHKNKVRRPNYVIEQLELELAALATPRHAQALIDLLHEEADLRSPHPGCAHEVDPHLIDLSRLAVDEAIEEGLTWLTPRDTAELQALDELHDLLTDHDPDQVIRHLRTELLSELASHTDGPSDDPALAFYNQTNNQRSR